MDRRRRITYTFRPNTLDVTYTNCPTVVNNWLNQNVLDVRTSKKVLALGLDVEWKPNFVKGQKARPVAVLQLSTEFTCLVFHIINMYTNILPGRLVDTLADQEIMKVGCGIREDVLKMNQDYDLECNGIVDIVEFAYSKGFIEHRKYGLKSLCKRFLEMDMEKPRKIQLSNWENFPLCTDQIEYAAQDAWISIRLFLYLKSKWYDVESLRQKPTAMPIGCMDMVLNDALPSLDRSSRIFGESELKTFETSILVFTCFIMIAVLTAAVLKVYMK